MEEVLTFNLPASAMDIVPGVRVTESISSKSYIACFSFEGPGVRVDSAEETPTGLFWSKTLEAPFAYVKETEIGPPEPAKVVYLSKFRVPLGANAITVRLLPWSEKSSSMRSPFAGVILETSILDRPTIILAEKVDRFGNV